MIFEGWEVIVSFIYIWGYFYFGNGRRLDCWVEGYRIGLNMVVGGVVW